MLEPIQCLQQGGDKPFSSGSLLFIIGGLVHIDRLHGKIGCQECRLEVSLDQLETFVRGDDKDHPERVQLEDRCVRSVVDSLL